jgi:hypothetical protein
MTIATPAPDSPSPAAIEFALLQSWLSSPASLQLPLHAIEAQQSDKGRQVLRLLLQTHLQQRGDGDVGPALLVQSGDEQLRYAHRRLGTRSLTTVFGSVELVRMGYSRRGASSLFISPGPLTVSARALVLL